jgi:hypothetical protein
MAFLQELATNKEKLLKFFLSDATLVQLLSNKDDVSVPALGLRYTQVFPYHWLSETITEEKSYLCFAITVPRVVSSVIKDIQLDVWLFSHDGIMRTPNGPRIDLIAAAIDSLLNGSTEFGFGKVELNNTRVIKPAKDFYGYQLTYTVQDFNRFCSRI